MARWGGIEERAGGDRPYLPIDCGQRRESEGKVQEREACYVTCQTLLLKTLYFKAMAMAVGRRGGEMVEERGRGREETGRWGGWKCLYLISEGPIRVKL